MKAIVVTSPGRVEWRELPAPVPGPGQVLIRTGACGICATDLAMIAGWARTGPGAIPGHEWAGTVEATGQGVDRSLAGRRCVAENVVRGGGEVGFEHPGGYAQRFVTDAANIQVLPEDVPFAAATLIEPLAVCMRALNRLGTPEAGWTLVFGDGPIGLLLVMLLVRNGSKVALVGGREERLKLATELGAAAAVNYHHEGADLGNVLARRFGRELPQVIEASGSAAAMEIAFGLVQGGRILVLGDYGQACAQFAWNTVLHRELTIIGSNASAGGWPAAVSFAATANAQLSRLVSHVVPAAEFERGLALVRDRRSHAIKVVLEWPSPD